MPKVKITAFAAQYCIHLRIPCQNTCPVPRRASSRTANTQRWQWHCSGSIFGYVGWGTIVVHYTRLYGVVGSLGEQVQAVALSRPHRPQTRSQVVATGGSRSAKIKYAILSRSFNTNDHPHPFQMLRPSRLLSID